MNAKVEKAGPANVLDVAMTALAVMLLVAGLVAYYWFQEWSGVARFGVLLAGLVACVAVGAFTKAGRANISSSRSSSCARSYGRRATKRSARRSSSSSS